MSIRSVVLLFAAFVWCLSPQAGAMTPLGSEFTYQGSLMEAGVPLDGTADFDFALWDADLDGNQIGSTVTLLGETVAEGLFTVGLDFGLDALNGDERWLEIMVDGILLSPRQKVTGVPYALQTRGIFVDDEGNVGLGTTAPERVLHTMGDIVQFERNANDAGIFLKNTVDGSIRSLWGLRSTGLDTGHVYLTDQTVTKVMYLTDGNMGVGTGSPANKLSVAGDANFTGNVGIGTDAPATELDVAGTVTATSFVGDGSGLTNLPVMDGPWAENGSDIFYDAGNVGIGTTAPAEALHVSGGNILADRGSLGAGLSRSLVLGGARSGGGEPYARLQFQNFDDNNGASDYVGAEILSHNDGSADAGDLRFFVNDGSGGGLIEGMRIEREGNVGIGTTNPGTELEVIGAVTATAFVGDGSGLTGLDCDIFITTTRGDNTGQVPGGNYPDAFCPNNWTIQQSWTYSSCTGGTCDTWNDWRETLCKKE